VKGLPQVALDGFETQVWPASPDPGDAQFSYWNDEEVERSKPWNVVSGGGIASQERHIETSGLLSLVRTALTAARRGRAGLGRIGADLACGTAWAVPYLLEDRGIERVYCVEYSRHRLFKLAPVVLRHYGVEPSRVALCLGSFYELRLDDGSLDFAFLAEAFHHANDPRRLLRELRRVLRSDGVVIIIGEHIVPSLPLLYGKHAARWLVSRAVPAGIQRRARGKTIARPRALWAPVSELLAANPVMGDHYYRNSEYARLFVEAGFHSAAIRLPNVRMQGFVLRGLA
jgi:ubiquinone/menaquinone biosynthesis C-methylase UbiE